jgi:serralysin
VLAQGDRIDLAAIDADPSAAGDQAFAWLGVGAAFTGASGQLAARQLGADLEVLGDVNGDGVADMAILVKNNATLTASAFIL